MLTQPPSPRKRRVAPTEYFHPTTEDFHLTTEYFHPVADHLNATAKRRSNPIEYRRRTATLNLESNLGQSGVPIVDLGVGRSWLVGSIHVSYAEAGRPLRLRNKFQFNRKHPELELAKPLRSRFIELVRCEDIHLSTSHPPTPLQAQTQTDMPPLRPCVALKIDTKNDVWKNFLLPGHSYQLRFPEGNLQVPESLSTPRPELDTLGIPEWASVLRTKSTISFSVANNTVPPNVFAKLELPKQCHLSGPTPFTFAIEYFTDSDQPITVDKSRSPLSVFEEDLKSVGQLLDCRNKKTNEKVRWAAFFGCWDSDPHPTFPSNDDFVEILPGKPWRFECTLDHLGPDDDYDDFHETLNMVGLEAGQTYKAAVGYGALAPFRRWQYGRKSHLLCCDPEENERRWKVFDQAKKLLPCAKQADEPSVFTVVE